MNKRLKYAIIITLVLGTFYAGVALMASAAEVQEGAPVFVLTSSALPPERHRLDSFADVYESVAYSVVSINTVSEVTSSPEFYLFILPPWAQGSPDGAPRQIRGAGSGIIFYQNDESVYIVTNFHVVEGAVRCYISLDDEIQVPARFIGGDERADIAVIAVSREKLAEAGVVGYRIATFGYSDYMRIGDQVMAVGNALGAGQSATLGIVSAKNRPVSIDNIQINAIQTDASINRGNSGGPLVNMAGAVIGINTAKFSGSTVEGVGYAIPSSEFVGIIETIMKTGSSIARPFLGITWRSHFILIDGEPVEGGVLVVATSPGHSAHAMGLMAEDIIIMFNGVYIFGGSTLVELILSTEVGGEIEIRVVRGNEILTFTGAMGNFTIDPEF